MAKKEYSDFRNWESGDVIEAPNGKKFRIYEVTDDRIMKEADYRAPAGSVSYCQTCGQPLP